MRALEKRPVSVEQIETAVSHIKHELMATGEREVSAIRVGEAVMQHLRELDHVAYVRFASVYRSFQDLNEFREEIDKLSAGEVAEGISETLAKASAKSSAKVSVD